MTEFLYYVEADGSNCTAYNHIPEDDTLIKVPGPPDDWRKKWEGNQWGSVPETSQEQKDREVLADSEAQAAIVVELYKNLVKEGGPIEPANVDARASASFEKLKTVIDRKGVKK